MTELMPSLCNDCISRNQCGKDDVKMCASYIKEIKIKCDDCKFVENCVDYGWKDCKKFTPKSSEPMTNEEYLKSCNTEQLAEFLADRCNETVDWILHEMDEHAGNIDQDDYWYRQDAFVEWLKQPHKEGE